jgi:hypothetical protein
VKPVLGSLGANTLVILTAAESQLLREALDPVAMQDDRDAALEAFNAGIQRGTAHLNAEFADLQRAKKQGK